MNQLHVLLPHVKLSTYQPCSFAVAGPTCTTWNNLPEPCAILNFQLTILGVS